MKKPEKSIERRKATLKRGAKRRDRFKKTQATKWERNKGKKQRVISEAKKFQSYMQSLNVGPGNE